MDELWKQGYSSQSFYMNSERLRTTVDRLRGTFNGWNYTGMVNYLLYSHGVPDPYMCLADFDSYLNVYGRVIETYLNRPVWNRKSLVNIASAGFFSSDRSIREYAENIWHISPVR